MTLSGDSIKVKSKGGPGDVAGVDPIFVVALTILGVTSRYTIGPDTSPCIGSEVSANNSITWSPYFAEELTWTVMVDVKGAQWCIGKKLIVNQGG